MLEDEFSSATVRFEPFDTHSICPILFISVFCYVFHWLTTRSVVSTFPFRTHDPRVINSRREKLIAWESTNVITDFPCSFDLSMGTAARAARHQKKGKRSKGIEEYSGWNGIKKNIINDLFMMNHPSKAVLCSFLISHCTAVLRREN